MNKPFFSIIIPFYNVEKYITKCLESIIEQEYTDYEVILVDDGSQDSTRGIVEEKIKGCYRFRLIIQDNSGVSTARNKAMDVAKGKYLWFIDSDDWIENGALEIIHNHIREVEVLGFSNYQFFEDDNFLRPNPINADSLIITNSEIVEKKYRFETAPWIYVFNKDFLEKNKIRFREDIYIHEDEFFLAECLQKITTCQFISNQLYYHRIRQGSLMRSKNTERKLYAFSELNKLYQKFDKENSLYGYWQHKLYGLLGLFYKTFYSCNVKERKEFEVYNTVFRKTKVRLLHSDLRNQKIVKLLHNYFFPAYKRILFKS